VSARRLAIIAALWAPLWGCGTGDRIAECDRLVERVEKVSACPRIERSQRQQIEQAAKGIREALDRLSDVGFDKAPAGVVLTTRQSCTKQFEDIRQMYEKVAPECL
jgi:hypothetical protein